MAKEGPQDGGDEQTPHRDEDERMRELAVELEAEKRIGGGADENIKVGSETRQETNRDCEAGFILFAGTGTS